MWTEVLQERPAEQKMLAELDEDEVAAWIAALPQWSSGDGMTAGSLSLDLAQHAETFKLAGVDGEMLCQLTVDDLAAEELGASSVLGFERWL
eukprot:SAG31_NODE_4288_length_3377_cov_4.228493_1_plen_92_part_00